MNFVLKAVAILLTLPAFGISLEISGQEPEDASMSYLKNSHVKLGVDLNRGGAIVYFARANQKNMVNNFDRGRQVQVSFFSGPIPYSVKQKVPAKHWRHIGWNPIQAGDDFGNKPKILNHTNNGKTIYCKVRPLQWPLDNVPGECFFETWIELEGPVTKVRGKLTNHRSDRSRYQARLQELPAVYCNPSYSRIVSYQGDRPFESDKVTSVPKSVTKHPWSFWQGTECWSAILDETNNGLGLITPNKTFFTGGFAGLPGPNETTANSCSYVAAQSLEILDHNIVYEFNFELIAGSIDQIREYAKSIRNHGLPTWSFEKDRQGWHSVNSSDQGWPIREGLRLNLEKSDPQIVSPYCFWLAKDAPILEIKCALLTSDKYATVYWQPYGSKNFDGKNYLQFPVLNDGQNRTYRIDLSKSALYKGGIIRLRCDFGSGHTGDSAFVKSIRLLDRPNEN